MRWISGIKVNHQGHEGTRRNTIPLVAQSFGRPRVLGGRVSFWLALAALVAGALSLLFSASAEEKRISIYSTAANYSLPTLVRSGQEYVGLLEVLEPLGSVHART